MAATSSPVSIFGAHSLCQTICASGFLLASTEDSGTMRGVIIDGQVRSDLARHGELSQV
jgi:hypothetical protein